MDPYRAKSLFDAKFGIDALWNYGSLGVQAVVGLLVNFYLLRRVGFDALGVFNQLYAVFVISGQLTVLGLHDSAQKHVAEHAQFGDERHSLAAAAILVATVAGAAGALVVALTSPIVGMLMKSANVGEGVFLLSPGLFLFVLNKTLMGVLNGSRQMIALAIGQSARSLSVLAVCVAVVELGAPMDKLGLCFTIAEAVVFAYLLLARPIHVQALNRSRLLPWMRRHASFGSRAVLNSFLSETFLRIDILILGLFLDDGQVGIYSFAAFFLEGLYMIPVTVRYLSNPILVRLISSQKWPDLVHFARWVAVASFAITTVAAGCLLVIFPLFSWLADTDMVASARPLLLILSCGLTLYSPLIPFDYILMQAGRPASQSVFMVSVTCFNVLLNLALIPAFGLLGAAFATSISFVFSGFVLYSATLLLLGMRGGLFAIVIAL